MIESIQRRVALGRLWPWVVSVLVLLGAAALGSRASSRWLILLLLGMGAAVLLWQPVLGLYALVTAALVVNREFGSGTEVALNPATLLVPMLLAIWFVDMVRRQELRLVPSRLNRPMLAFLLAGLLSLLIGNALWDPAVPYPGNFLLVQLAQWAVYAFSIGVVWLTGNLMNDLRALRRLTLLFLALAGGAAILIALSGGLQLVWRGTLTTAFTRSPLWLLLAAVAGGQLLFNKELPSGWVLFLLTAIGAVLVYAFCYERATASNWVGVTAVAGVLAWLRWPRLRWLAVALLVVLAITGVLSSSIYSFAGGGAEWAESGGSRLVLTGRVLEVSMRNPVTGLGPASYRAYARVDPLPYMNALWIDPRVSSHNNYVDLFSQFGLLGLGLFFWIVLELTRLGLCLRAYFTQGFAAGYINGVLAAEAGALVLMLFADWMLPFVYNIGFPGFQASVLVWLFLGGLISLEQVVIVRQQDDRSAVN